MNRFTALVLVFLAGAFAMATTSPSNAQKTSTTIHTEKPADAPHITIAGGCFWCVESEFRAMEGVLFTRVGYTGGEGENPTYDLISSGKTGHAEAVEVYYDPDMISAPKLLDFFLRRAHDPTQKNRQGPDVGTQYRSAIFYATPEEKSQMESIVAKVDADRVWTKPVVTTLEPLGTFWEAEEYHQQYYEKFKDKYGVPHVKVLAKGKK